MAPAVTTAMRAWQVRRPGPMATGPLEQVTAEVPRPEPSELLVAVRACGVCRTDLHVTEGDLPVHRPGVTPGHEVVGEVVAAGPGDPAGFAAGDRAGGAWAAPGAPPGSAAGAGGGAAWLRWTDGPCRYCARGSENLCPSSTYTGWD